MSDSSSTAVIASRGTRQANPSGAPQEGVWVVVPALNEGERLGALLGELCTGYANVVVVDDGSRDATSAEALQHPVWLLRHIINCGQGAALQTGIDFALHHDAEILVTFDGDGQHCVEDITSLLPPIRAGDVDVVLGSRFLGTTEGMPLNRRLLLRAAVLFTRVFSRIRVTDTHNGMRALSRHAAQTIRITLNRMEHASELLDQIRQHELRYCEVPVTVRYSAATLQKGQSSWNSLRIAGKLVLARIRR